MKTLTPRQKDILQEALQLIAERGMTGLTYRNLARRLGVSEPAFYRHFSGKTDILLAILDYFDQVRRDLFAAVRGSRRSSLEQMEAVWREHLRLFAGNPALAMLLFPEEVRQDREALAGRVLHMMETGQGMLAGIIRSGVERGELREDVPEDSLALVILGSLRLLVTRWRLAGCREDLPERGQILWNTLARLVRRS